MSKVIDLDEKEKEETILFLAKAHLGGETDFVKNISTKVTLIVLPFLTNVATSIMKEISEEKGGEKDGTSGRFKNN